MTADAGSGPKYRLSRESVDCQFMTNISSSPMMRHPCQAGSGRLRPSRSSHLKVINGDGEPDSAHDLSWQRHDPLKHRKPGGKIIVQIKEGCERIGRLNGDKLGDAELAGRREPIKADRNAVRCVPDVAWRCSADRGNESSDGRERRKDCAAATVHDAIRRRRSQA